VWENNKDLHFIVIALVIAGLILGFGILRRNHNNNNKCSDESCGSFSTPNFNSPTPPFTLNNPPIEPFSSSLFPRQNSEPSSSFSSSIVPLRHYSVTVSQPGNHSWISTLLFPNSSIKVENEIDYARFMRTRRRIAESDFVHNRRINQELCCCCLFLRWATTLLF